MTIRPAQDSDLNQLTLLFEGYLDFYKRPLNREAAYAFLAERLQNQDSLILVADMGDHLSGFVQAYPLWSSLAMKPSMILNDLFVDPKTRKQGVGDALMKACEDEAQRRGCISLMLQTAETNITAQSLYEKRGWKHSQLFRTYNKFFR